MENNKNKKSVKFQRDMLKFCDFIQVFVFTRNHHLNFVPHCEISKSFGIYKYYDMMMQEQCRLLKGHGHSPQLNFDFRLQWNMFVFSYYGGIFGNRFVPDKESPTALKIKVTMRTSAME